MKNSTKYFVAIILTLVTIALFAWIGVDIYDFLAGIITAVLFWSVASND